jgi:hypothetical protein
MRLFFYPLVLQLLVRIAPSIAARLFSEPKMPRFSYFGALLGLTALLSAAALAQSPSDSSAAKVAYVELVSVHAADVALSVEIQTSGARVAPNTQVITDPDRIVVDFPGALPAAALHALTVNQGALKGIRTGLFFKDPPITRVVLDLAAPQSYQISTTGNGIVLKLNPVKVNPVNANSAGLDPVKSNPAAPNPANSGAVKLNAVKSSPENPVSEKSKPVKSNPATLNAVKSNAASSAKLNSATLKLDVGPGVIIERYPIAPGARMPSAVPTARLAPVTKPIDASPAAGVGVDVATANVSPVVSVAAASPVLDPIAEEPAPARQAMAVTFANGMLSIRAEKVTLAQVLYEVQRQTQAEIAIPAGAEQEQVAVNLGPAAAREVLASLLNGSGYNFIFMGSQERLERVILTLRDPNIF